MSDNLKEENILKLMIAMCELTCAEAEQVWQSSFGKEEATNE